jgi:hypothetical protein
VADCAVLGAARSGLSRALAQAEGPGDHLAGAAAARGEQFGLPSNRHRRGPRTDLRKPAAHRAPS